MSHFTTPLGLTLANPGTGEPFSTAVVNGDFVLLDTAILADRVRLTTLEAAGAIRPGSSGGADWVVASPAALSALTTGKTGDIAWMTAPGTGISPMFWVAVSGTGVTTVWNPLEYYVASTKANADAFATAINAISNLTIQAGCRIFYGDTRLWGIHTSVTNIKQMHEGQRVSGLTAAVSGGAASVNSDGTMFATAVTASMDIDGIDAAGAIFTSYKIIIQVDSSVGTGALTLSLRSGGAVIGAAAHSYVRDSGQNSVASSAESGQQSGWGISAAAVAAGIHYIEVTIRNFTSATRKPGLIRAMVTANPMAVATAAVESKGIYFETASAADGFRLSWTGTSWTGVVHVIGVL